MNRLSAKRTRVCLMTALLLSSSVDAQANNWVSQKKPQRGVVGASVGAVAFSAYRLLPAGAAIAIAVAYAVVATVSYEAWASQWADNLSCARSGPISLSYSFPVRSINIQFDHDELPGIHRGRARRIEYRVEGQDAYRLELKDRHPGWEIVGAQRHGEPLQAIPSVRAATNDEVTLVTALEQLNAECDGSPSAGGMDGRLLMEVMERVAERVPELADSSPSP